MTNNIRDNAGVIAPPPLIYLGPLGVGLLLSKLFPVEILPALASLILGGALIAAAVLIMALAIRLMRRAGTEVNPSKPSTALVVEGPFRFTRNPLYVSLTLLYAGISVLANAVWAMAMLPAVLVVIERGVIRREERYPERKFGEEYRRYKSRVRRWI